MDTNKVKDLDRIIELVKKVDKPKFASGVFRRGDVGCCILEAASLASGHNIKDLADNFGKQIRDDAPGFSESHDPHRYHKRYYLPVLIGSSNHSWKLIHEIYDEVDSSGGEFISKNEVLSILNNIKDGG